MFRNMKTATRLGLSFGIVVFMLIIISIVSLTKLSQIDAIVSDIIHDKYPKTDLANNVLNNVNIIARAIRNSILIDKKEEIQKENDRISEARKKNSEYLEKLTAMTKSDEGKAHLKALMDARVVYYSVQDEFTKLLADGKQAEAKELLMTKMREAQSKFIATIDEFVTFQEKQMGDIG
ncbi:MAG: MCP four helix bundle domain-containing protein [Nitrospirae bacterium]|nr:MCP four helix bundle domain-containing protein [Nitrospirota bacterium]